MSVASKDREKRWDLFNKEMDKKASICKPMIDQIRKWESEVENHTYNTDALYYARVREYDNNSEIARWEFIYKLWQMEKGIIDMPYPLKPFKAIRYRYTVNQFIYTTFYNIDYILDQLANYSGAYSDLIMNVNEGLQINGVTIEVEK